MNDKSVLMQEMTGTLNLLDIFCFAAVTIVVQVQCQPLGLELFEPPSACHGVLSAATAINATCAGGHVIAVGEITMGAKPTESGCPLYYNDSLGYDNCCTYDATTDCTFRFTNKLYHDNCNGKPSCYSGTQQQEIFDSCISLNDTFGAVERFSNYVSMDFYCIEDDKMVEMCSAPTSTLTLNDSEVYIWNRDFSSSSIQPTDTNCSCSVEIDNCEAGIDIYTMYRQLTGDGTDTCNQTLSIRDAEDSALLFEWSCDQNTLIIETDTVSMTYILVNLENHRNQTDGKFWLGFKATAESNITVSCPPSPQQFCELTNTTTTTTTTTSSSSTTTTTVTMTTTHAEATNTSITNSTEPQTTPSSSSVSSTENTTPTTREVSEGKSDDNLEVIVLCVLIGLLVIVIIVLLCCLLRRCCTKTNEDAEKVDVDKKQQLPPPDVTKTNLTDFNSHLINTVDFGCQVQIGRANEKADTAEQDLKQKAEKPPVKGETLTEVAEFGCQVCLPLTETETDKTEPSEEANSLPPVLLSDKETLTLPISQSHRDCQTDDVRKKSQKIQANIEFNTTVKTVSCQTDTVLKDDTKPEEPKQVTTVPNGNLPASSREESDTETKKFDDIVRDNHRIKRRRSKKKRTTKSDEELGLRFSNKSPASLEAVRPDIRLDSPANQRFSYKLETEMEEETDLEEHLKSNKDIRTIYVKPESPTLDTIPSEVNHIINVRNKIAYSFFEKERKEEKLIRMINKQSKNVRKKKKVDTNHSEC